MPEMPERAEPIDLERPEAMLERFRVFQALSARRLFQQAVEDGILDDLDLEEEGDTGDTGLYVEEEEEEEEVGDTGLDWQEASQDLPYLTTEDRGWLEEADAIRQSYRLSARESPEPTPVESAARTRALPIHLP